MKVLDSELGHLEVCICKSGCFPSKIHLIVNRCDHNFETVAWVHDILFLAPNFNFQTRTHAKVYQNVAKLKHKLNFSLKKNYGD